MIYRRTAVKVNRAAGGASLEAQGLANKYPPVWLWSHTEQGAIAIDIRPMIELRSAGGTRTW